MRATSNPVSSLNWLFTRKSPITFSGRYGRNIPAHAGLLPRCVNSGMAGLAGRGSGIVESPIRAGDGVEAGVEAFSAMYAALDRLSCSTDARNVSKEAAGGPAYDL